MGKLCRGGHTNASGQTAAQGGLPAAGNRNDGNLNNAGSNGNYWSSTLNTDNPNNAWNVNFNSSNVNRNNNNRYNGQSVRPVSESPMLQTSLPYSISKEQLLEDLYRAYLDARRHKRRKRYQLSFERNLERNLVKLRDEIYSGKYVPGRSTCFIIHDPKMREVFAASFRDRVVHHLLYNYVHSVFEKKFIADSYSCIPGRGTHYGIDRLRQHIVDVSCNYSKPCYVLKMDISGYFMSMNRLKLLNMCREILFQDKDSLICSELVDDLLSETVLQDPTLNCRRIGCMSEWDSLPPSKSLFCSSPGCGLPIGNLTSQLFSNVYLNALDHFVTETVGEKHYGRYVDDFYIVSNSRGQLHKLIQQTGDYLSHELFLSVNSRKTEIRSSYYGVIFLGSYVKPFRTYLSTKSIHRMRRKLLELERNPLREQIWRSLNSILGLTIHSASYHIRLFQILPCIPSAFDFGYYTSNLTSFRCYDWLSMTCKTFPPQTGSKPFVTH